MQTQDLAIVRVASQVHFIPRTARHPPAGELGNAWHRRFRQPLESGWKPGMEVFHLLRASYASSSASPTNDIVIRHALNFSITSRTLRLQYSLTIQKPLSAG
jgi:hypothetical protein